jgi:hypothetical protein
VMMLAFVAGLAFALGHHAFYSSLDGQPVDGHLFRQQKRQEGKSWKS